MADIGEVDYTSRGFQVIRFKDENMIDCSLQQSSAAICDTPGAGAIWLGVDNPMSRMHLDIDQVRRLIVSLQRWVDTGSFDNPDATNQGRPHE